MKILIVGQYFFPDNFRINEISQALVKQGHSIDILTGLPDYSTGKIPKEYKSLKKRIEIINGATVFRVPIIARRKGILFRSLNYLSFLINSTLFTTFCKKDYDLIFAYQTSPITMANAAVKMKRRISKPLFFYCLDIWPECLKAWNISERSILFRLMHLYSKHIYNSSDVIGISSQPFNEYLTQVNQVNPQKIKYLPQHCEDLFANIALKYVNNNTVDFVFAGNIGSIQDVECIIKAVFRMDKELKFKLHVLGDGSELNKCKELTKKLHLQDKITFYGRISHEQLEKYYELADAFLLTLKGDTFMGSTMPAKLQEYMSIGKPVLAAIQGAASEIIIQADCGFVVNPSDNAALSELMTDFIKNIGKYRYMGENGRAFYKTNFTQDVFMENINKIFNEMVRKQEDV